MRVRKGSFKGRRERAGTSAVEFALVAPLFVALVMGQIETSRLGMVSQLITTAAREGCRVAVLDGSTEADVQNRVTAVLSGSGIPVGTVTPITVSLSVPYAQVSWLGAPFFLANATVSASATLSSENP
jgi:Flp pilus assembly protein TadG